MEPPSKPSTDSADGTLRDRSSSNNSGSSKAKSGTLRIKTKKRNSNASSSRLASQSDGNSLTSFPSLSPSLANSPENTQRRPPLLENTTDKSPLSNPKLGSQDNLDNGRPSNLPRPPATALDELFSPASDEEGRSALFGDTPSREVPGAMHHQSDAHIKHMIARMGATTLVKQMALDLAQRDAQVTLIQRRAEERERLLKKMLQECEVSNMDIENRLKELELESAKETRKASGKSMASDSSRSPGVGIDSQLEEAFEDVWAGREASNGAPEQQHQPPQQPGEDDGTIRKTSSSTMWKGFFGGQSNTTKRTSTTRPQPTQRSESAQQKLSAIHTASQHNLRRKGLSSDLFKPPPPATLDDRSSVATASDNEYEQSPLQKTGTNNSNAASVKSSSSMTSWAMKLVGGGGSSSQEPQTNRERVAALKQLSGKETVAGSADRSKTAKTRSASTSFGPNGTLKRGAPDSRASTGAAMSGTTGSIAAASTEEGQGPTEMDTILPDAIRPPTLAPHENVVDSEGLLTDRFGFIYDHSRRLRQSLKNKNGSRVETVENHRKSFTSRLNDEDAASISSQLSADKASPNPPSAILGDQRPKRWQDYLTLSSLSGGELLSHTPSAGPITDIVTGAPGDSAKKPPKISISNKGLDPTSVSSRRKMSRCSSKLTGHTPKKAEPSPSRVSSANAAPAKPLEPDVPAIMEVQEQDSVKSLLDQLTEIHDTLQRGKASRWNDFLKKIRTERSRTGDTGTSADRRSKHGGVPEASWMDGEIIGIAGLGNEGKVGRAKWLEFKNLVLGGIPVAYRAKIWAECSGASGLRVPGYYDELVAQKLDDQTVLQQIRMDIPRTLTDNIFFRKGQGMQKLEEILVAYAIRNPEIGYCQGMNMITANLLLIMPTAEDAFWVLVSLIEYILPEKYYDHSLLASRADQTVLRQYVSSVLPQLSSHLDTLSIELEALTFQWFLSVFTDCLSAEALFRVWDVVLCTQDGATFLFQLALALLKLNEKSLLACESPAEVYAYINGQMTDHAVSIDGLIRASEGLRKVFKREEIMKRRAVVIAQELDAARERDAIRKGKARVVDVEQSAGSAPDGDADSQKSAQSKEPGSTTLRRLEVLEDEEDDMRFTGELELRSPMPVDEEMQWRA